MQTLHTIEIKYIGPTNTRGSRIKLTSYRFCSSVTIPYNNKYNNIYEQAEAWLLFKGFNCEYISEAKNGYAIHSTTFKDIKVP